jgi:hypothetical protein
MFKELRAELAKMDADVRRYFTDLDARLAAERARIEGIDANLVGQLDRIDGLARESESKVRGRLAELRSLVGRLTA